MTDDLAKAKRKLHQNMPGRDYAVGYAKPPSSTQFKKGKSGNPRGRPKGAKNKLPALNEERLKSIVLEEAYRDIKIQEGGREIKIYMAQAVMRSLAVNAAKGDVRSQRLFLKAVNETESANKQLHDAWCETAMNYKNQWSEEIERCRRLNLPIPEPIPHPDHIEIDMATGRILVKGPFTPEEKIRWDRLRKRKKECQEAIKELGKMLADPKNAQIRKQIQSDIDHEQALYDQISKVIKD